MKRLLIIFVVLVPALAYSASQPHSLGTVTASTATFTGSIGLQNLTVSQITALSPQTTGQTVYCTNCTAAGAAGTICISTAGYSGNTKTNQFVLSTGTVCK